MPLPKLLDAPDLPVLWHHGYGLTEDRKNALTGDGRYSLFNANSETALTLFTIGRLDGWIQGGSFTPTPRTEGGWNQTFFDNLRSGASNVRPGNPPLDSRLRRYIAGLLGVGEDLLGDAAVLFEFEARNRAFTSGVTFNTLSFLNIEQKWSMYDAVVMIPRLKRFLFIEAKLGSDIGRKTTHFQYVNQVIRNLEAAYFICNAEDSLYSSEGWDFTYLVLCPRKEYEYRLSYFSNLIRDLDTHVAIYQAILEREYPDFLNRDRLDRHFGPFGSKVSERVKVIHWDDLWARLVEGGFSLPHYFVGLRERLGQDADVAIDAHRGRLRLAGVVETVAP